MLSRSDGTRLEPKATKEQLMQLGMVGLGRMGANLVRRGATSGHRFTVYDVNSRSVDALVAEGSVGAASLSELVERLPEPRSVWIMVPAAFQTAQM